MLTTTPNWLKKKTEKGVVFKPNGQGANFGGQDDSNNEGANEPERGRVGRGEWDSPGEERAGRAVGTVRTTNPASGPAAAAVPRGTTQCQGA